MKLQKTNTIKRLKDEEKKLVYTTVTLMTRVLARYLNFIPKNVDLSIYDMHASNYILIGGS